MSSSRATLLSAIAALAFSVGPALAQPIRVGVSVSSTGPAASLGIPERNTIALLPRQVAGQEVEYVVLDDGTDATRGVANIRKLIDEDHVDAVIGSTATPASAAMSVVAAEKQVPMLALCASASVIVPMTPEKRWTFKMPQNDSLMADAIAEHMAKSGVKTAGFIGFNDGYGDGWFTEFERAAKAHGIRVVAAERYARTDTSVTAQVLKVMMAKPDAVLVGAAGTPAALPQKTLKERGYKGRYYQTHGAANADFLRIGGKDVEGTVLPTGPVMVAAQLPESNPVRAVGLDYIARYEAANGPGSANSFGAHAYDAGLLLQAAIPVALEKGRPGTPAFRAALRDAIESRKELPLTHGVATLTPQDHNGFDQRARVMVTIQNGTWKLLP
ncbi:ABC transporter substrate-binding protein [Rhodovastum atsumiense]|uniref:ABC transporter substrate-binding protein n=1 Tax=Rhodovastum atsumiense TaxID=504468 RepID=A0A5M6J0Q6_9PROT|nr:ABC transporter substrate-binding protein [Rhodovastum atsumiense]KAA5613235.1 ABC transporter substrate-binding protein [Rhodovastum atsumiense]CAH2600608.1 ABC transporter substrate-binding protein [Rhodovastum atsumiense]